MTSFLSILFSVCFLFSCSSICAQQSQRYTSGNKTTSYQRKPQTSAEAKKRQSDTQREIQQLEEKIRQNDAGVKKGLAELVKLDQNIAASTRKIYELDAKLSQLESEISSLEKGIAKNEKDLETLRAEYLKAVKKMRTTRNNKSTLAFIFSAKSVHQATRRMRYLREFSEWRERQTGEINAKIADLKNQKEALTKVEKEHADAIILQRNLMARLENEHTQQELIIEELKRNKATLTTYLTKKQEEAEDIDDLVSYLISEEQRRAAEERGQRKFEEDMARRKAAEEEKKRLLAEEAAQASPSSKNSNNSKKPEADKKIDKTEYADARKRTPRKTPTSTTPPQEPEKKVSSFADMRGKLPSPSSGSFTITSPFGRQSMGNLSDVEYDNPGIDAESEAGATARAVFKGKVSGVYILPGFNSVVIVNHGSYYTVYGNIDTPAVKVGDEVDTGTNLGKLTLDDEDSSRSSIHFEVWKNREKLNPQDWLR